jgi:hypothetical protein
MGIRPGVRLFQFFFRIKKEKKEMVMINCGSITFVLRSKRVFSPMSTHESVWYWNAGWFYIKNEDALDHPPGLPVFINGSPVEKESWSYIPDLARCPELDNMALRVSKLTHDGLSRNVDFELVYTTGPTAPVPQESPLRILRQ